MEITDEFPGKQNKKQTQPNKEDTFKPSKEHMYIAAIHDLCARIDLAVSEMMNVITNLNNAKNHYLKLIGQMRQEQEQQQQQGESISSK